MAIELEFIDFIVPIEIIKEKYPGGWAQCLKDHEDDIGGVVWFDEHLFRAGGAMNPMDIRYFIDHWQSLGFHSYEGGDNPTKWVDFCVVEGMFGGATLPCDWIVVERDVAYKKGFPKGEVIHRDNVILIMNPSTTASKLNILPCIDSDERSAACRHDLDIPRDVARDLGRSALEAATQGWYIDDSGTKVDWSDYIRRACAEKVSISPEAVLPAHKPFRFSQTRVQVMNETTLRAARRLVENGLRPLALNFANGVVPGGGFLNGARAQEEVLCRSSALYQTLAGDRMYEAHRKRPQPDSTAWAIYSPDVPVFRNDDGTALNQPWLLSFITCAAPVARRIMRREAVVLMQERIHRILAIAQAYGYSTLVLGAWGCGAFGNDPVRTAEDFRYALKNEFRGAFSDVVFAITDWSPERRFLGPFNEVFS